MRKLVVLFIVSIIALIGVLLAAPQFIPMDTYKEQITRKVEAATGRQMAINGDVRLRFLPRLQMSMENVELGNPDGFTLPDNAAMMSLRELHISLGLWSLLQGRADIDRFELVDPVIRLARDAQGQPNWEFTALEESAPAADAAPAEKSAVGDIRLPQLLIRNGTISYRESPEAEPLSLSQLNMELHLPSLYDALTLTADTRWNGTVPVALDARLASVREWLDGKDTPYEIALKADNGAVDMQAQGMARNQDGISAQGDMRLDIASLKALGTSLDMTLLPQEIPGEGKLALRSTFDYAGDTLSLEGLALTLDNLTLSGTATLGWGARPRITAALEAADSVAVDAFLPKPEPSVKPPQDASASSGTGSGWSSEPVIADASFLKAVDADIHLALPGLSWDKLVLGAFTIHAKLEKSALTLDIPEFPFYDGTASSQVQMVVPNRQLLSVMKEARIRDADIGRFLKDAYGFDRLSGKGDMTLDIHTNGISVHDFVSRVGGTGNIAMRNGAIHGFNLAELVRNARTVVQNVRNQDFTADMRSTPLEGVKTDFATLSASFTLTDGIMRNSDFALQAPLMNVTGSGTVNLPLKTVDYRLKPTLVGSIEGEGRTRQTQGGVTIPLRVTGTFDRLKFTPDASGVVEELVKDPEGTVENLEENFKGLRDDVKSLFKGL